MERLLHFLWEGKSHLYSAPVFLLPPFPRSPSFSSSSRQQAMVHEARLVSLPPSHNGHLQKDLAIRSGPSGLYHVTGGIREGMKASSGGAEKGLIQWNAHRAAEAFHTPWHVVHPGFIKRPGVKQRCSRVKDHWQDSLLIQRGDSVLVPPLLNA